MLNKTKKIYYEMKILGELTVNFIKQIDKKSEKDNVIDRASSLRGDFRGQGKRRKRDLNLKFESLFLH